MTTMTLGKATVTAVGCGDVSLTVAASRGVDSREVDRALNTALELGITMVDVAAEPDSEALVGLAIRDLRLRDRVTTAMKIDLLIQPGAKQTGEHGSTALHLGAATVGAVRITAVSGAGRASLSHVLPVAYLVARVEAMLRASKLDAIPLVQVPLRASWRRSSAWPELVGTALRLVREGKVLQWGALVDDLEVRELSNEEREERRTDLPEVGAVGLVRERWLASLAMTFNACDRHADPVIRAATAPVPEKKTGPDADSGSLGLALPPLGPDGKPLPAEFALYAMTTPAPSTIATPSADELAAAAHRPAILARHPLAGAALAGTLGPGAKFTMRDDRELDHETLERIALGVARAAALVRIEPPAARSSRAARTTMEEPRGRREDLDAATLAELALRFVIDRGAIALPRLHRHIHIPAAFMAAMSPPLTPEMTAALIDALT